MITVKPSLVCETTIKIKICLQTKAFSQPRRSNQLVQRHFSRGCIAKLDRSPLHNFSISQFDGNFFEIKLGFAMRASGLEPSHALKSY